MFSSGEGASLGTEEGEHNFFPVGFLIYWGFPLLIRKSPENEVGPGRQKCHLGTAYKTFPISKKSAISKRKALGTRLSAKPLRL